MKGVIGEHWDHTAGLFARLDNALRAKGDPSRSFYDYHPFKKKPRPPARKATPEDIKRLFGRQQQ